MGEQLGQKIRDIRTRLGITLRDAAQRLEISPPHLSDVEYGRRNPGEELLIKIAKLLDVDVEKLKALDSRLPSDIKRRVDQEPAYGQLLRTMIDNEIDPRKLLESLGKKKGK